MTLDNDEAFLNQPRPEAVPAQLLHGLGRKAIEVAGVAVFIATSMLTAASGLERTTHVSYYPNERTTLTVTLGHVARLGSGEDAGCSALVLQETNFTGSEEPVAAVTATHCVAVNPRSVNAGIPLKGGPDVLKWIPGSDGKEYVIESPTTAVVQEGANSAAMKTVGVADEILVSTNGNTDQALEVLRGHSAREALALYQEYLQTPEQLAQLKTGDIVHVSGWPDKQDGDGKGNLLRQDFDTVFIARGELTTDTGETMGGGLAGISTQCQRRRMLPWHQWRSSLHAGSNAWWYPASYSWYDIWAWVRLY